MSTKVVEKKETFYDRMERDRHRREELAKQNNAAQSSSGFSAFRAPLFGYDDAGSQTSPSH